MLLLVYNTQLGNVNTSETVCAVEQLDGTCS